MQKEGTGFEFRGVYECGWNLFNRKGFSTDPADISVRFEYLDFLKEAGINRLVVFWTNSENFDRAWESAAAYAHSLGIRLARGVYGFCGGGSEYTMTEPDAPESLLVDTQAGPKTGLCPFNDRSVEWMLGLLAKRLEFGIDGIFIEPAREIGRNCQCPRCQKIHPFDWDVHVLNLLNDELIRIKPDVEVFPYLHITGDRDRKREWSRHLDGLRGNMKRIFAWGMDNDRDLADWLAADARFSQFAKLGRMQLFPGGKMPAAPVEERVGKVFQWCKMAADQGKTGYIVDYRIFGGQEWQGHETEPPCTRPGDRVPASLMAAGNAMLDPYLDSAGQKKLLERLRSSSDWDLDDPSYFYRGIRTV